MANSDLIKYIKEHTDRYEAFYRIQTGKAFMLWYAVEGLGLDEDTAYEAVSYDGGNDKSIDLFFIDESLERVLIAQGKYHSRGAYKPMVGEFFELVHSSDWLQNPESLVREGREDLAAAASEYNAAVARGFTVEYLFVYMGPQKREIGDAVAYFNQAQMGSVPQMSARAVNLDILQRAHDEQRENTRISVDSIRIPIDQTFELNGAFGRARVVSVPGGELKRLHTEYGDALFDRNVRLFLGARKGSVNAGIQDTLDEPTERRNFWAYNNGLTFICDRYEYDPSTGDLTLHNFSVVNGCQTTVSVSVASDEAANEVMVLARVISASQEPIVDSIITNTNRQTPIQLWDIASQDKLQKRIKKELAAKPHPYLYIIRPGGKLPASERKFFSRDGKLQSMNYALLAQYLAAFEGLPVMAYKDKGKLLLSERSTIFPPDIRVEKIILVWQAAQAAENAVREAIGEAAQRGGDAKDEIRILRQGGKLFVLAVMAIILRERNGAPFLSKLKRDVAGSKNTAERLHRYAQLATLWYIQVVKDLLDSGAVLSQLLRSQDFFAPKLRDRIRTLWKVMSMSKNWVDDALPKL